MNEVVAANANEDEIIVIDDDVIVIEDDVIVIGDDVIAIEDDAIVIIDSDDEDVSVAEDPTVGSDTIGEPPMILYMSGGVFFLSSDDDVTGGVPNEILTRDMDVDTDEDQNLMNLQETVAEVAGPANESIVEEWKIDEINYLSSLKTLITIFDRPWEYNETISNILNDEIENDQTGKIDTELTI